MLKLSLNPQPNSDMKRGLIGNEQAYLVVFILCVSFCFLIYIDFLTSLDLRSSNAKAKLEPKIQLRHEKGVNLEWARLLEAIILCISFCSIIHILFPAPSG